MANPTKFVSVNLNKSYGRPQTQPASSSSRFGNGPRGRTGGGGVGGGGGGGGGGMVVLSRPRSSSQKVGARLAVPPPLNLPSLRKEHERQDPAAGSGSLAGAGSSGIGAGHASAGVGWTKPVVHEKDGGGAGGVQAVRPGSGAGDRRAEGLGYAPPGSEQAFSVARPFDEAGKAAVLRGEDFPSLAAAAAAAASSFMSPQKAVSGQRQKLRLAGEETLDGQVRRIDTRGSPPPMRPQMRASHAAADEKGSNGVADSALVSDGPQRKVDGLLTSPLPVVRLTHTLDWADDERDTGHGISDRSREKGFTRSDSGRGYGYSNGRAGNDSDVGSAPSRELYSVDSYGRDLSIPGRDGTSWRASQLSRDGMVARGAGVDRGLPGNYKSSVLVRENIREAGKHGQSHYMDGSRDGSGNGTQDLRQPWRDSGHGQTTQTGRNGTEGYNLRNSQQSENAHGRYGDSFNNRYKANELQKDLVSKIPYSFESKGLPLNDPLLNFSRDKHFFSHSGKPYVEDASFDTTDPFSDDINLKLFRRKKETLKQASFHDPIRDSFEAELERVQKMQEEERQRALEEQTRALELARKEEEERERIVREEKERRKRLEDEAREAVWRAEQERLEASKKAEEEKIVREEEKKRIVMEEERRKDAARQKLLELEARIARRQAEAAAKDVESPADTRDVQASEEVKEGEIPRTTEDGDWEDSERMVERVTSSASSDSSGLNRGFETGSRPSSSRDGNSFFIDRPKHVNYWKKDAYDNGNSSTFRENGYYSQQQDAFGMGRVLPKKGYFGSIDAVPGGPSSKEGMSDFHHTRGHGWGVAGDGDQFHRNSDFGNAFLENENYSGGAGWGQAYPRGSPHSPCSDSLFQSSDTDSFNSFGRSRHFMRQPRVLPPPFSSVHKGSFRAAPERPSYCAYLGSETRDYAVNRNDEKSMKGAYGNEYQKRSWQLGTVSAPRDNATMEEHENNARQCDSQSSVSVSSPPTSPAHLSHDDLDESRDFRALPASTNGKHITSSDDAHAMSVPEVGITEIMTDASSVSLRDDDEWIIENNDDMQDLEEYDEDGNLEEVEVHEGDCENFSNAQHFEDPHLNMQDRNIENDQLLLGFNEGIEVKIPDNDEFEQSSCGEGKIDKQTVTGAVRDLGSFDGLVDECGTSSYSRNSPFRDLSAKSPDTIGDTEKALQHLVIEPMTSTCANNISQTFVSSEVPPKHQGESAFPSQSSFTTHSILSSISAVHTQTTTPMELQFGLFSGPSLIPSPVPAIQIGSIQMPLHLHPPVGQPIFGQLRYPSPISQGILPLPFMQSSVPPQDTFNQNLGSILHNHVASHSSIRNMQKKEKVIGNNRKVFDVPQENFEAEESNLSHDNQQDKILEAQHQAMKPYDDDKQQIESEGDQNATPIVSSQFLSGGLTFIQSKRPGTKSTGRGKMYVYTVKNAGSKSQFSVTTETSRVGRNSLHRKTRRNIRRTEFRVRESTGRRHEGLDLSNCTSQGDKPDFHRLTRGSIRNVSKKGTYVNRSTKLALESQSTSMGALSLRTVSPENKTTGKEAASKQAMSSVSSFRSRDGSLKSNEISEKVVDAPLQSGVVQIFKQPGIEIPSDEDDFIEVRSKRQMLNDRREQKEKEIKAKSRVIKAPRKHRSTSQSNVAFPNLNKANTSASVRPSSTPGSFGGGGTGIANCATSTACSADMMSQPLFPIGTPQINADDTGSMNKKAAQTSSDAIIPSDGSKLAPGLIAGDRSTPVCNITTSLDSWNSGRMNHQVMSLTQTQLDDAMKPAEFDTHATSIGNTTSIIGDQGKLPTSAVVMDKTFSTSTTLSSLLSGEKIQFGAITTPAILPPVIRVLPTGIGPPGSASCRSDFSVEQNLSASEHDSTIFFEKEKCLDESCAHLEDQDAEAEAAASAVAVAAIGTDEVVGNGMAACSDSVPASKNIGGAGVSILPSGVGSNLQEVPSQSAGEESLTVTLPADLSVETPSLSSWPAFPSPQSSSGPLLSHFPGPPSSQFPFFDMNSMLGGPVFAFGSHDESAGTQSQPQRSTLPGSGPLGAWPQCQSAVESFYGPPAGFPGPFINPQGGIPGIQGPPQMLFYNPFAPQYSLSVMGATTFVPPGKQPDWKHNPVSTVAGVSESDTSNLNVVPGQHNSPSIPSPIHHLGQVAPLVPMASHLPVFDMSSFQSSTDVPVQARWPHLPGAALNSAPISVQLEHRHIDGVPTQAVSQCLPADLSTGNSRFPESCTLTPVDDGNSNFGISAGPAAQFPRELALVETTSSGTACILPRGALYGSSSGTNNKGSSSGTTVIDSFETVNMVPNSNNSYSKNTGSVIKSQIATPSSTSQQHLPPIGCADHRGHVASQKAGSGSEWHRRTGLQGRSQVLGADKNFPASKVKQVYVAKQPASGTAAPGRTRGI